MPLPVVAESDDLGGLPGRHLSRRIFRSVHKNRPQVTSHTDVTSDESKQQHAPNPCSPTCSARDINLGTPAIGAILETDLSHLQFNSWVRIQIPASAFFDALECQIPPKSLDFSIRYTAPVIGCRFAPLRFRILLAGMDAEYSKTPLDCLVRSTGYIVSGLMPNRDHGVRPKQRISTSIRRRPAPSSSFVRSPGSC
jgi:hypothetical protein